VLEWGQGAYILYYNFQCPDGFLFDPVMGWCDEPDTVVCWGAQTTPTTTTTTAQCSSQLPAGKPLFIDMSILQITIDF
jgi:hypothetical protein